MVNYKYISIYFDKNRKLIGVPCGNDPKFGEYHVAELDIFFDLEPDYSDEILEKFIADVFDACFSKEISYDLDETTGRPKPITALQKYTGKKGYTAASKSFQSISITWLNEEYRYEIRPLQKDKKHRGAFTSIKGLTINVAQHNKFIPLEKGALALAFRTAMNIIASHM